MPDLDDLFEELFDGAKKKLRKSKKKRKKEREKRDKEKRNYDRRDDDRRDDDIGLSDLADAARGLLGQLRGDDRRPDARRADERAALPAARLPATLGPSSMRGVQTPELRDYLAQAEAYREGITQLVAQSPTHFNRARVQEVERQIERWQASLAILTQRVDQFRQNELLQADLQSIPRAIQRLETQLTAASSPRIEQELVRTLANRRQQLATLETLRETMEWAEIKIENTITMLGTLYSQALTSQSKGEVADYRRLLTEVEEESRALGDYVEALGEVKLGGAGGAQSS